jgi:RNA polymerase primary sigma factor
MPLGKVRHVLKIAKAPLSLATPIGDEDESQLGDFIEDKDAVLPIDATIQSNLREATTRARDMRSAAPSRQRIHCLMRENHGRNSIPDRHWPTELSRTVFY